LGAGPPQLQPRWAIVVAGANWIVRTIDMVSEDELRAHFSLLSHAVRGLALWRGKKPYKALRSLSEPERRE